MKLYSFDELPEDMIPEVLHPFPDSWYYIIDGDKLGAIFKINLKGPHPPMKVEFYKP
jgi:hypothetical protein